MSNQEQRILQYIEDHGSITALEAMQDIGVMRLSSRICDLRKKGVQIQKQTESTVNRYGERCIVVRYYMENKSNRWA